MKIISPNLDRMREQAKAAVANCIETARNDAKHATPLQAQAYELKRAEAAAWQPSQDLHDFPLLVRISAQREVSVADLAQTWLAKNVSAQNQWQMFLVETEVAREAANLEIDQAQNVHDVRAVQARVGSEIAGLLASILEQADDAP